MHSIPGRVLTLSLKTATGRALRKKCQSPLAIWEMGNGRGCTNGLLTGGETKGRKRTLVREGMGGHADTQNPPSEIRRSRTDPKRKEIECAMTRPRKKVLGGDERE